MRKLFLLLLLTSCNWVKSVYIKDNMLADKIRRDCSKCITPNNKLTNEFYNNSIFLYQNIGDEFRADTVSFEDFNFSQLSVMRLINFYVKQNTNFNFSKKIENLVLQFEMNQKLDNLDLSSCVNLNSLILKCDDISDLKIKTNEICRILLITKNKDFAIKFTSLVENEMVIFDAYEKEVSYANNHNYIIHYDFIGQPFYAIRYETIKLHYL